jgi:hypothetical protein
MSAELIPSFLTPEQETLTMGGGADPCPVPDCPISAQEHHRLARGIMAENAELKRQVADFESGRAGQQLEVLLTQGRILRDQLNRVIPQRLERELS